MMSLAVSLTVVDLRQVKLTTAIDQFSNSKQSSNKAMSPPDAFHRALSPVVSSCASSDMYKTS